MAEITLAALLKLIDECDTFHQLHEEIAHKQGKITKTDEARHQQNLYRAQQMRPNAKNQSRMPYIPNKFKASWIEDEFADFRHDGEVVVVR